MQKKRASLNGVRFFVCLRVDTGGALEIPAEIGSSRETKQWEEQNAANKWIDYKGDIRWYDLFGWGTGDEWNKNQHG